MTPTVVMVIGVSGSGKTTVGTRLAERLGWAFKEGDELHPQANIAKMHCGVSFERHDRAPWLAAVAAWIDTWLQEGVGGVITCSALKQSYRRYLADGRPAVALVFLEGPESVLAERSANRRGRFMSASILKSQLDTLGTPTPDDPLIRLDTDQPVAAQVDAVIQAIATGNRRSSSREQA